MNKEEREFNDQAIKDGARYCTHQECSYRGLYFKDDDYCTAACPITCKNCSHFNKKRRRCMLKDWRQFPIPGYACPDNDGCEV